jgi:transcription antitermination protein NusB
MTGHRSSRVRKSRICALQMLYQWDIGKETPELVKQVYWREVNAQAPREYADLLFDATTREAEQLDAIITRNLKRWKVTRLTTVDRNLLRLAITEFRHSPETPGPLVINEALEVARLFSGEGSIEFLNGVLDSVYKSQDYKEKSDDQKQS